MRIWIEIEQRRPLVGQVRRERGEPAPFAGWLALLGILERVVEDGLEPPAHRLGGELDARGKVELAQRAGDMRADRPAG